MPDISAVIPVWNRARVVARAIDSVLAQALPAGCTLETLIVDDGSTDGLDDALARYGDRIRCVRHGRNLGAAAARNTGVAAATGDYVAFLDSDDIWLPGKLAAQLAFMASHAYPASCTAVRLKRAGMAEITSPRYPTGPLGVSDFSWGCFVSPGSTLICRRDAFHEVGEFDTTFERLEDWDWLLRYAHDHRFGFLAEPLAKVEIGAPPPRDKSLRALKLMSSKHSAGLTSSDRRHFSAALAVERAAANFRHGDMVAAAAALIKAIGLAPVGNSALAAVLHNRLSRAK